MTKKKVSYRNPSVDRRGWPKPDLDDQCHHCIATPVVQPVLSLRRRYHCSNRQAFVSSPPPKKAAFNQTNDGA